MPYHGDRDIKLESQEECELSVNLESLLEISRAPHSIRNLVTVECFLKHTHFRKHYRRTSCNLWDKKTTYDRC